MTRPPLQVSGQDLEDLVPELVALSKDAGTQILRFFETELDVERKSDASPVTEADRAAERVIVDALASLTPNIPVVAEESFNEQDAEHSRGERAFWLVDPLDGTKEFVAGRDEFTVNIGLVVNRTPVVGVVHLPARDETFWGFSRKAFHRRAKGDLSGIHVRTPDPNGLTAVASRSHRTQEVDSFLQAYSVHETISAGSSLKFCLVAMGQADVYPRFGPTMEWDTAAGHAILIAAGGNVLTMDRKPLQYGKPGFRNPDFLAFGGMIFPPVSARPR